MPRKPQDPRRTQAPRTQAPPPWDRATPTLVDLARMEAFAILTHPSNDKDGLIAAVEDWAGLDPEVRSYIMARVQMAQVTLLDRLVRRTERLIALSDSVRTGTRLTVDELRKQSKKPPVIVKQARSAPEPEYEDEDEEYDDEDFGFDNEDEDEDDFDGEEDDDGSDMVLGDGVDAALAAQFDALDNSPGGVVEGGGIPEPAPRRSAKKAPAKKAPARRRAAPANGQAGPAVEVIDKDGTTVTPAQPEA